MIEREVDFTRPRRMRCGSCGHEWHVTAEWIDRFSQAHEGCPICGTDCQGEDRPDFCVEPDEPLRNDDLARKRYWYHSSTHSNWPDKNFDPAAGLTEITKQRMNAMGGNRGAVESWSARQKTKALHLGSYESAIENMFRRMNDQADGDAQFYLYRVLLDPHCVIEPGVQPEPTNWLGDAHLSDICGPGVQVLRYVNIHEDPSSVSLATELNAIHAAQGMPYRFRSIPMTRGSPKRLPGYGRPHPSPRHHQRANSKACAANRPHGSQRRPTHSKPRFLPDYRQSSKTGSVWGSTRLTSSRTRRRSPRS